jgi:hypothetical protein
LNESAQIERNGVSSEFCFPQIKTSVRASAQASLRGELTIKIVPSPQSMIFAAFKGYNKGHQILRKSFDNSQAPPSLETILGMLDILGRVDMLGRMDITDRMCSLDYRENCLIDASLVAR